MSQMGGVSLGGVACCPVSLSARLRCVPVGGVERSVGTGRVMVSSDLILPWSSVVTAWLRAMVVLSQVSFGSNVGHRLGVGFWVCAMWMRWGWLVPGWSGLGT